MPKVTSIAALRELRINGEDIKQRDQIRLVLADHNNLTRSEIANKTGLTINAVCGRVAELLSSNLIAYSHDRKCTITGKYVETLASLGQ